MDKLKDKDTSIPKSEGISDETMPIVELVTKDELAIDESNTAHVNKKARPRFNASKLLYHLNPRHFSKKLSLIIAGSALLVVALIFFVEPLKFGMLNLVTKTSADFVVIDDMSLRPIENAKITTGVNSFTTNKNGKVTAKKIKFGTFVYKIVRDGYYPIEGTAKAKIGKVLVGPVKLKSSGIPVTIKSINKLSGKGMSSFKVALADTTSVTATSDKDGSAILNVPNNKVGKVDIILSAEGFNDLRQTITVADTSQSDAQTFQLTPAGHQYFLSNRSGKIDVFVSNLDGTEQSVIIAGKGPEDNTTSLVVAPDNNHAFMISKRDAQKGPDGRVLPAVYAVDLRQKTIKRIDEGAPRFEFVGWIDNSMALYSVNYDMYERTDNAKIKKANIVNGDLVTIHTQPAYPNYRFFTEDQKHIYFTNNDVKSELYGLVSLDIASKKTTVVDKSTVDYPFIQNEPHTFSYVNFDTNKTYLFNMESQTSKMIELVDNSTGKYYIFSPSFAKTSWVENRDGKGVILVGNKSGANGTAVSKKTNVNYINRFFGEEYVIYTVSTNDENASYILDIATGTATKISDIYRAAYNGH